VTEPEEIDAIPTTYAGTDFRSRLEAKWATFLDSHHITWQYEPETITLPSGIAYIPDFWLPELGIWIEVKGDGVPRVEKAIEFGQSRACHCNEDCTCAWPGGELVLIGHPPKRYDPRLDPKMQGVHHTAAAAVARRHGGHPAWSTTTGRRAWLGVCPKCSLTGWFSGHQLQCRACRKRPTSGHLYVSGETPLAFPRDVGDFAPVLPADPEREAAVAEHRVLLAELWAETDDSETW
jgi:hypothetical protein